MGLRDDYNGITRGLQWGYNKVLMVLQGNCNVITGGLQWDYNVILRGLHDNYNRITAFNRILRALLSILRR